MSGNNLAGWSMETVINKMSAACASCVRISKQMYGSSPQDNWIIEFRKIQYLRSLVEEGSYMVGDRFALFTYYIIHTYLNFFYWNMFYIVFRSEFIPIKRNSVPNNLVKLLLIPLFGFFSLRFGPNNRLAPFSCVLVNGINCRWMFS